MVKKPQRLECYQGRIATFKNWIFKDGTSCSASQLALAGFYYIAPGTVSCYYCCKELDGWEIEDIPWNEHKTHASHCPFVKKYKTAPQPDQFTLVEVLELEKERFLLAVDNMHNQAVDQILKMTAKFASNGSQGNKTRQ